MTFIARWRRRSTSSRREEPDRYVPRSRCDMLVEEGREGDWKADKIVAVATVLDSESRGSIFRAFYVPFVSDRKVALKQYAIVRNAKR